MSRTRCACRPGKTLREGQGWSQGALADQLQVSRQTVNALETGRYDPSLPLAFRIARLFGRPIEAIFHPDDEQSLKPLAQDDDARE
jgi:putative transcriptional regulator